MYNLLINSLLDLPVSLPSKQVARQNISCTSFLCGYVELKYHTEELYTYNSNNTHTHRDTQSPLHPSPSRVSLLKHFFAELVQVIRTMGSFYASRSKASGLYVTMTPKLCFPRSLSVCLSRSLSLSVSVFLSVWDSLSLCLPALRYRF